MADARVQVLLEVVDKASGELKKAAGGFEDFSKKLNGITPIAAGVAAGVGAMAAVSIKSASDLTESTNKAAVTFRELGDAEKLVLQANQDLAESENALKAKGEQVEAVYKDQQKALKDLESAEKAVNSTKLALMNAQENYNRVAKDGKATTGELYIAEEKLAQAADASVKATQHLADIQGDAKDITDSYNQVAQEQLDIYRKGEAAQKTLIENQQAANEEMLKAREASHQLNAAVKEFGDQAATSYGMSRRTALEYTASMGGIFQATGLASDETAGMSIEMVKLAADVASFNNLSMEDALEKIRAGLVGETEPLRQVGVLLNATTVAEKALKMGLAATKEELTEGDKVRARYALILEQTSLQQGDFARTSGTMANQMRSASAHFENASATLGTLLLPMVTALLKAIIPIIEKVQQWIDEHPKLARVLAIAALAIGGLMAVLVALGVIIPPLIAAFGLFGAAITIATGPIGLIVLAIAGLIAIGILLWKNWDTIWAGIKSTADTVWGALKSAWDTVWGAILSVVQPVWEWIRNNWQLLLTIFLPVSLPFTMLATHWSEVWGTITSVFTTVKDTLIGTWQAVQDALTTAWNALVEIATAVFGVIKEIIEILLIPAFIAIGLAWMATEAILIPAWNFLRDTAVEVFQAIYDFIVPIFETIRDNVIEAWNTVRDTVVEIWTLLFNHAWEIFEDIRDTVITAFEAVRDTVLEIWNAVKSFLIDEIWTPIKDTAIEIWGAIKTAIETATSAARDVIVALWTEVVAFLSGIWNAIKSVAQAIWDEISSVIRNAIIAIVAFIGNVLNPVVGVIKAVWEPLQGFFETAFNGIKNAVETAINAIVGKIDEAIGKAREIIGVLGDVIDWVGRAIDKIGGFLGKAAEVGKGIVGGQHGGTITQGGLIRVGEAGPELVALPKGARIFSNAQSRGMSAEIGAGATTTGKTINVIIPGNIYGFDDFIQRVKEAIRIGTRDGAYSELFSYSNGATIDRVFR